MNSEWDIIEKYFSPEVLRDDVELAGGDDCAIVCVPDNKQLLITTDTLISGVHFPKNTPAADIAYKAIMVNLSDLAAMGATPAWCTLAITLPNVNQSWLQGFSKQFNFVLSKFNISLIGGDTTKGELSITVGAMGFADKDRIMRRDKAEAGDKIYVTGELGDAAIGLHAVLNNLTDESLSPCIQKLNRPEARVSFAEELVLYAKCAIDISDGLVADLGHIIKASCVGANIHLPAIPVSPSAHYYFETYHSAKTDWSLLLTCGDDYELCFTVNEMYQADVEKLAKKHQLSLSCIGEITDSKKLVFYDINNKLITFPGVGFNHF
ncbi:thiamine-phosphate kinase [Cardiobacterium sp. AH-315-I02]|nr:thiamine-phosphate kinase [Cardiobacterium sp. AH-315-I02]